MPVTEVSGPFVTSAGNSSGNPDYGPSLTGNGNGLLDTRYVYPYGAAGLRAIGYKGNNHIPTINAVPSAKTVNALAASQAPTTSVALTLVSTTGAGITVTSGATTVQPSGNVIPSGTLAIDGLPGTVYVSQTGATQLYDPSKALARAVTISSNGNDSTASFTVKGYDVYGYPMSDTIQGSASSSTVTTLKAFKFVSSITPTGTINSTMVAAGQSDVYGLPLRADYWGDITVYWNSALITANTGFVAADATSPATAATGDVRGTYAVQTTASNGTVRLQIFQTPSVADLLTQTGLWGVSQV